MGVLWAALLGLLCWELRATASFLRVRMRARQRQHLGAWRAGSVGRMGAPLDFPHVDLQSPGHREV